MGVTGARRRGPGRLGVVGLAIVVFLVAGGCVGVTTRDELTAELRARGGGVDLDLVGDALDDVAEDLGGPFALLTVNYTPLTGTIVVQGRNPSAPDEVDTWTFTRGERNARTPNRSPGDDLETRSVPVGEVDLDVLATVVPDARDRAEVPDGWVDGLRIAVVPDPDEPGRYRPVVTVDVEGERSGARVTYDLDGTFLAVEPS